jgi:hypothetical protein
LEETEAKMKVIEVVAGFAEVGRDMVEAVLS